ncbi:hypothetical protein BH20ACT2_BH20ACT2_00560 [soil metagenome]
MDPRTEVVDITVEREAKVTVVFADGRSCAFGLDDLRRNCPCAACRNIRDQGGVPWPEDRAATVAGAKLVGAWGLSLTWADGHATGIYPWEALRRWCEGDGPAFGTDSGLGAV